MISSNVFRSLAVAGALSLVALAAPAEAAVFQASTTFSWDAIDGVFTFFSLPQYSGPGTIVGVNIALGGSASETEYYPYDFDGQVTVPPHTSTWNFGLIGPPDASVGFLSLSTTTKYPGGSCAVTDPACPGFNLGFFSVSLGPNALSGSVNVFDFSDYAGGGTNAFDFVAEGGTVETAFAGSATVTETILAAVPEAPTWVMALIGFVIVGFAARGRRLARPLAARRVTNEAV